MDIVYNYHVFAECGVLCRMRCCLEIVGGYIQSRGRVSRENIEERGGRDTKKLSGQEGDTPL